MAGPYVLDVNTPTGAETRRLGDDRIRDMKNTFRQVLVEGPMSNFPTDNHCSPGWPRIFVYATLAELQANVVATPYNRLGVVTADPTAALIGFYVEKASGWTRING